MFGVVPPELDNGPVANTEVTQVAQVPVATPLTVLNDSGAEPVTDPNPLVHGNELTTPDPLACKHPAGAPERVNPPMVTLAPLAMNPLNGGSAAIIPVVTLDAPEGSRTVEIPIHPLSTVGTVGVPDATPALSW
jgi:hypothetical protein